MKLLPLLLVLTALFGCKRMTNRTELRADLKKSALEFAAHHGYVEGTRAYCTTFTSKEDKFYSCTVFTNQGPMNILCTQYDGCKVQ